MIKSLHIWSYFDDDDDDVLNTLFGNRVLAASLTSHNHVNLLPENNRK